MYGMKKIGLITLSLAAILLSSCGNRISEGQYLLKNYCFADSTLERLVTEAVEAIDLSDSVLLELKVYSHSYRLEDDFDTLLLDENDEDDLDSLLLDIEINPPYNNMEDRIYTVGIQTFHPEYHYGADNRANMDRLEGVVEVAGHKCFITDCYGHFKRLYGRTLIALKDSLDDDIVCIQIEDEYHFFLDTLGRVVRDSVPYKYTSSMFFDYVYTLVENEPQFPGGYDSLQAFVDRNLRNPRQVEGKVYVEFVVERNGHLTDIKVPRGIDEETDEEALRVIRMMPRWEPARQRDVPVRFLYHYPVCFKPTKK